VKKPEPPEYVVKIAVIVIKKQLSKGGACYVKYIRTE